MGPGFESQPDHKKRARLNALLFLFQASSSSIACFQFMPFFKISHQAIGEDSLFIQLLT
jgi:hypothetical protein